MMKSKFILFALCCSIGLITASSVNAKEQSSVATATKKAIRPGENFSAAIAAGDYVFLSGTIGTVSDGQPVHGISRQTIQVLEQRKSTLAEVGLAMSDVVKVTVFIRYGSQFAAMNDVYHRYFPVDPPARSTVVVGFPDPAVLVEIEMIAYRGK